MIQLKILSGKQAGATRVAARFPLRIGRAATADLRLTEDGVWEQHLLVHFRPGQGYSLTTQGEALATVNGEPVQEAVLHNGDVIRLGAVELQFWLAEARQTGLGAREVLAWLGILVVCLVQFALLYWLVS